jgi:hypothetical protein
MKMLTLIKREVEEILIFSILPVAFTVIFMCVLGYKLPWDWAGPELHVSFTDISRSVREKLHVGCMVLFFVFPLMAAVLGTIQMRTDLSKKISTFLSTHATTRDQILTARILVGITFLFLLVLAVFILYLSWLVDSDLYTLPGVGSFFIRIFSGIFVLSLACYSMGLLLGANLLRLISSTVPIIVISIIAFLVIIKGFGLQSFLLLLIIAAASLIRLWQKFTTMPL